MKTTMKSMLALMAGAMVFAACSNDDITENIDEQKTSALKPMIFTASMEGQGGASRATIDGPDIKWVDGDKISIFDGSEENNGDQEFTLTSEGGSTSGTFEGDAAEATTYYALYPYTASLIVDRVPTKEEAIAAGDGSDDIEMRLDHMWKSDIEYGYEEYVIREWDESGISKENQALLLAYLKNETRTFKSGVQRNGKQFEDVVLPAEQTVAEGQYVDPKAMLMIGKNDDANSFQFKNVCAYVKVTPKFDCTAIRLISKGTESLAGTVTLDYNDGTPTANVTANGVSMVSLTGTIKSGNTYYIAVLPAALQNGFTIRFVATDAIYKKSTNNTLTLARNKVINLGSFATSDLTLVPTTGTAKATIGGETVYVPWVQLWEDGPKFAEYNVGATSVTDYDGYYGWGGMQDKGGDCVSGAVDLSGDTDTATKLWGSEWRMPTMAELEALVNSTNCTLEWIDGSEKQYNGTNTIGLLCKGKEGTVFASNSVFLPASGYWGSGHVNSLGYGEYWSSTHKDEKQSYTLYFGLNMSSIFLNKEFGLRGYAQSVRAVLNE